MAKKRKKYKVVSHELTAKHDLKQNLRQIRWNVLGKLAIAFIVIFGIYQIALVCYFASIMVIYFALLMIGGITFVFLNHGFSHELTTREALPASWSSEKKDEFLSREIKHKKWAKKMLYIVIPLLLTLAIDFFQLFWLDGAFGN